MEELNVCEIKKYKCQNIDPYYIFEHINEVDISKIAIDFTYRFTGLKLVFNDKDHPVTYTNNFVTKETLSITEEYYSKHQDLIDKLIIEICKKTKSSEFTISSTRLINEQTLSAIKENKNIKQLTLGNRHDTYTLDSATFNMFNSSEIESIVCDAVKEDLKNNFDPRIYYNINRDLVNGSDYKTLTTTSKLEIIRELSEEEIDNLKYLNEFATVRIHFDDSPQIIDIINRLKSLNPNREIIINVKNKNSFNHHLFSHLNELKNLNGIKVISPNNTNGIDLTTYIKYEKTLLDMIKPAINLSPFEKYLYAYNITKLFKEYKESPESRHNSRNLYQLLNNEYMVCAGFSNLLGDLLDKLNIENNYYSVKVETAYDGLKPDLTVLPNEVTNKKTKEKHEILPSPGGHARREIHLCDPKYNIDGYFIADPTWDNEFEYDSYIHALMSHDEYVRMARENYMDTTSDNELFFIHNIEEFYQKLNILLDKNPEKKLEDYIKLLLKHFYQIDKKFYQSLHDKYQIEVDKKIDLPFDIQQDILFDIGIHIIKKVNNPINGETLKQGITIIYQQIYDSDTTDIKYLVTETMRANKEKFETSFPTRYKIDKNGNQVIADNEFNKFDLEKNPETKITL